MTLILITRDGDDDFPNTTGTTPDGPRALTEDEIREQFLQHVKMMVRYWAGEGNSNVPEDSTVKDRLDGLAFSLLALLDGSAIDLPGFKVIANPHPDDEAFHRERGENFYPTDVDIAGYLHEVMKR